MTKSAFFLIIVLGIALAMVLNCAGQAVNKKEPQPKQIGSQLYPAPAECDPLLGIKLLGGYKCKNATDFEGNKVGEISKNDGVSIKYEMGLSQGLAVIPGAVAVYVWYREQKMGNRIVRYALSKKKILIISIPLSDDANSLQAANFYGKIRKPEDIADMLLTILPFIYTSTSQVR